MPCDWLSLIPRIKATPCSPFIRGTIITVDWPLRSRGGEGEEEELPSGHHVYFCLCDLTGWLLVTPDVHDMHWFSIEWRGADMIKHRRWILGVFDHCRHSRIPLRKITDRWRPFLPQSSTSWIRSTPETALKVFFKIKSLKLSSHIETCWCATGLSKLCSHHPH